MQEFKNLIVWKESHSIALCIYKITDKFPRKELFGITSQIRRAATSVSANISEGCGRNSQKDFIRFLNMAMGSANETEYLLILSKDLNYLEEESFENISNSIKTLKKQISNLINAIKKTINHKL